MALVGIRAAHALRRMPQNAAAPRRMRRAAAALGLARHGDTRDSPF
jgi:hypothetical protein